QHSGGYRENRPRVLQGIIALPSTLISNIPRCIISTIDEQMENLVPHSRYSGSTLILCQLISSQVCIYSTLKIKKPPAVMSFSPCSSLLTRLEYM
ncbi:hypothetical protein CH063_03318, partial [Colletotrichum higginsianum]